MNAAEEGPDIPGCWRKEKVLGMENGFLSKTHAIEIKGVRLFPGREGEKKGVPKMRGSPTMFMKIKDLKSTFW